MKKKIVFLTFIIISFFSMKTNAQNFAKTLSKQLSDVEVRADHDPEDFSQDMKKLEEEWGDRKDPVERAIVHALFGSAYNSVRFGYGFDSETREYNEKQCAMHFSHLLDDAEELAKTKASKYSPLVIIQKDGEMYSHDMLAVMVSFLDENANIRYGERRIYHEKTAAIYASLGNRNAEALMLLPVIDDYAECRKLLDRCLDIDAGMDVAYRCLELMGKAFWKKHQFGNEEELSDNKLRFIKWVKDNVKMSDAWTNIENTEKELRHSNVSIETEQSIVANQGFSIRVNYYNAKGVKLSVRKYKGTRKQNGIEKLRTDGEIVTSLSLTFGDDDANKLREAQGLPVRGETKATLNLPVGHYVVVAEGANDNIVRDFFVTSMRLFVLGASDAKTMVYVLNAETGRPIPGAKVSAFDYRDRVVSKAVSDVKGIATFKNKSISNFSAVLSAEDVSGKVYGSRFYANPADSSVSVHMSVFTDRSIYRPGQTIKGSVLVYSQQKDILKVMKDEKLRLILMSSDHDIVTTLNLTSNAYGTSDFEFVLPDDAEVGQYTIVVVCGSDREHKAISVEEYKRPTFEVSFPKGEDAQKYVLGEAINVMGKALMFNGVPVQNAKVKYTIESGTTSWWWRNVDWEEIDDGESTTADDGTFTIPVTLSDSIWAAEGYEIIAFKVSATVTDQSGETHEAEWNIRVGKNEFGLHVEKEEDSEIVKVEAVNANGGKVDVAGEWQMLRGDSLIANGVFNTGESFKLPRNLQFDLYTLKLSTVDSKGNRIETATTFWGWIDERQAVDIHSVGTQGLRSSAIPTTGRGEQDYFFAKQGTKDFSPSTPARIYVSPSQHDAYIIYNVYAADRLVESGEMVLSNDIHVLDIPYRKEYGDGIHVELFYVRNGHVGTFSTDFTLARPEKKLNLSWSTFRNKLVPGQNEEWTLTVRDKNNKLVSGAEMMAVLYDAALDRIKPHSWSFLLRFPRRVPSVHVSRSYDEGMPALTLSKRLNIRDEFYRSFDILDPFEHGASYHAKNMRYVKVSAKPMLMAKDMAFAEVAVGRQTAEVVELEDHAMAVLDEDVVEGAIMPDFSTATPRTNFAETAFFLPHLVSDKKGDMHIAFTLPESLTEWCFRGFVHTDDLDNAVIEEKVIAAKPFMLRPNMPRFVRWGDRVTLSSSIVNQSDESFNGSVRMRLIDPENDAEILTLTKPFAIEAGKTESVSFDFDVPESYEGVNCEIIALSGDVSDGEVHYMPILSTRQQVVQTLPFYIKEEGAEASIDLASLYNNNSATATNRTLSIEYTDNPSWLCIEALRSSKLPDSDNAISFASALAANMRLASLMPTFPILAQHESLDSLNLSVAKASKKLAKLQMEDGGWSWYSGMQSSDYVTLAVCEMLARISNRNAVVDSMFMAGMKHLDSKMLERFNEEKKRKSLHAPSEFALRYLYLSSFMPQREVGKDVVSMRNQYLSKAAKKMNTLTVYGVANVAHSLAAFGNEKTAQKFVNVLKDYAIAKPGQGRFYATDMAYYSWMDYRIPTHTAAMRAIRSLNPDDDILNDMLLWLISQKQVQKWDNPMNTLDVADLMLTMPSAQLFHESKLPTITLDGKAVENLETGTLNTERASLEGRESNLALQGNVVAHVAENDINMGVSNLIVQKHTPSISWGAVQATYLEDVANLNAHSTNELKVSLKLYVERNGKWAELDEKETLSVGEKVRMRYLVKADRDMDFVRLTAQHPACFEPTDQLSGYKWIGSRGAYMARHDSYTDVNFDWFTRGTTTIDLEFFVSHSGTYQQGNASVHCAYAKQFGGYTNGRVIKVK